MPGISYPFDARFLYHGSPFPAGINIGNTLSAGSFTFISNMVNSQHFVSAQSRMPHE